MGAQVRIAPIHVVLTEQEVEEARAAGREETAESILSNRAQAHGYTGDRWIISEVGALGQRAFCKGMGVPWHSTLCTFKGPDYGKDIQIRTAACKAPRPPENFGNLIVRSDDNPQHKYVLVVGNAPYYTIKGWLRGETAQRPKWQRSIPEWPEPIWWVPWKFLSTDMEALFP